MVWFVTTVRPIFYAKNWTVCIKFAPICNKIKFILLQIGPPLLQNGPTLLQNGLGFTKWSDSYKSVFNSSPSLYTYIPALGGTCIRRNVRVSLGEFSCLEFSRNFVCTILFNYNFLGNYRLLWEEEPRKISNWNEHDFEKSIPSLHER